MNTTEFTIERPDHDALAGEGLVIDACPHMGRNICQHHHNFAKTSVLQASLNLLCDRLGKAFANTGDVLLIFGGTGMTGPPGAQVIRKFALLSGISWSPKFQTFTMCNPIGSRALVDREELALPLHLTLGLTDLEFVPGVVASGLHHETSSDLAIGLCDLATSWRLRVCKYRLLSPMEMSVIGFEAAEDFDVRCAPGAQRAQPARRRRRPPADLAAVFELNSLEDPLAGGAEHAARRAAAAPRGVVGHRAAASPSPPSAGAGPIVDQALGDDRQEGIFGDADQSSDGAGEDVGALLEDPPLVDHLLHDLGADVLIDTAEQVDLMAPDLMLGEEDPLPMAFGAAGAAEANSTKAASGAAGGRGKGSKSNKADGGEVEQQEAAIDELGNVCDIVAELADIVAADDAPPGGNASASSTDPPVAQEVAAALAPALAPAPPPPGAVGAPIPGGPQGWTMTPLGYVFFDAGRNRGRITTWGRNVSVRCSLHGCSKAKNRGKISDGEMAAWLARGVNECPVTGQESSADLKKRHMALFPL